MRKQEAVFEVVITGEFGEFDGLIDEVFFGTIIEACHGQSGVVCRLNLLDAMVQLPDMGVVGA